MERVIKACVKVNTSDNQELILTTTRHCEAYEFLYTHHINYDRNTVFEGFITNTNRIVNRCDAYIIAKSAQQLLNPNDDTTCKALYSEDVW